MNIPLIIPNFNQLSYLRNLINQFWFYYPDNPIYIIDNGSTYQPLLDWYNHNPSLKIERYPYNDFCGNLRDFLDKNQFEYYVISDPDISLPPDTPPYFLEVFKHIIDSGWHHCGFGLRTFDIPKWNKKGGWIAGDEKALLGQPLPFKWNDEEIIAYRAPLDTTFCMFKKGGWEAPMNGTNWNNSVRVFEAIHLTWYLHPDHLNEEMRYYFKSALTRDDTKPSAGRNHFRPE